MWVFFTARLRQWLFFAVAIPVLTTVVHLVRSAIEKRKGSTRTSRILARAEEFGRRKKR